MNWKMNYRGVKTFVLCLILAGLPYHFAQAQGYFGDYCDNGSFADSLDIVELSGLAIVDNDDFYPHYYLDTDRDGEADYFLSFGPYWYSPGNGNERPADGDEISVKGYLVEHMEPASIMVNELNGLEWRSYNQNSGSDWHGFDNWLDNVEVVKLAGSVMVDTSYLYPQYFLDTDKDDVPDYYLHFGPPWYAPVGVQRPEQGDEVSINGGLMNDFMGYPSVMVYELNGFTWRSSTGTHPWSGMWLHRDWDYDMNVYCQSDSASWINFPAGCFGGQGMMGQWMFPDSIFCQFEEIHPDYAPGDLDSTLIGCYFIDLKDPQGSGMMGQMGYGRGARRLLGNPEFRLHYNDFRLSQRDFSDEGLMLKGWDPSTGEWEVINDFSLDQDAQVFIFSRNEIYSYYGIYATQGSSTSSEFGRFDFSESFLLHTYPNPFTSRTTIEFNLAEAGHLSVAVYDLSGRKITTLMNQELAAGNHQVVWNINESGTKISSGQYFVMIENEYARKTIQVSVVN